MIDFDSGIARDERPQVWTAVVHVVGEGFDSFGYQRCARCGCKVLDHSADLIGYAPGTRLKGDEVLHGFAPGPVTVISAPSHLFWADKALAGMLEGATLCCGEGR